LDFRDPDGNERDVTTGQKLPGLKSRELEAAGKVLKIAFHSNGAGSVLCFKSQGGRKTGELGGVEAEINRCVISNR
jgi:hypothetical protein